MKYSLDQLSIIMSKSPPKAGADLTKAKAILKEMEDLVASQKQQVNTLSRWSRKKLMQLHEAQKVLKSFKKWVGEDDADV